MTLTRDQVQRITGDADRWTGALNNALARWSINTPERVAMFLAQCAHESSGFRTATENLHYSAARLLQVWPSRFTADEAVRMAYDERAIAERAYGRRLGNGPEGSGDGYAYRGRGIIQLTGRDNYTRCGAALGLDLVGHPELLERPDHAAQSAGWFWSGRGCNELADAGDYLGITRRINGGTNGQADRETWLATVRAVLGASTHIQRDERPEGAFPSPAGGPSNQPKGNDMDIALPLLAQLIPQVLALFSGRAQATIAEKTGADPKVAADFMQSMIAQVGHAVSVPVVDKATATQAVAALTALPAEAQAEKVAALERQALATIDALIKAGDKMTEWDSAKWAAELAGRDAASRRAIEERRAGGWDMTPWLVGTAGVATTLCSILLLVAIVYQSIWAPNGIDSTLLGLAGPLLAITFAAWKAIFDYRFDGTKEGTEQSKALLNAIPSQQQGAQR